MYLKNSYNMLDPHFFENKVSTSELDNAECTEYCCSNLSESLINFSEKIKEKVSDHLFFLLWVEKFVLSCVIAKMKNATCQALWNFFNENIFKK